MRWGSGYAALLGAALAAGCGADRIAVEEDRRVEASTLLLETLAEGEPAARARAALAMGRIQSPSYLEALAAAAGAPEAEVRHAALFALGQLALAEGATLPRTLFAALMNAIANAPEDETVALALEAMGKLGEPAQGHRIHPFLLHDSVRVRTEAALALFRCRFVPVLRDGADPPPALPEPAVQALIAVFADPAVEVRRAAVYACSRFGEPAAVAALVQRFTDEDEWVRMFAARGVGRSGNAEARAALVPLTADPSEHVRTEAVTAIAALGGGSELPAALASDESFHVRAALAAALGTGPPVQPGALEALAADASLTVRAAALQSLAARAGAAALPDLVRALEAEERSLRLAAVRAAAAIGAEGRTVIDRALADEDIAVRCAGLEGLGRLGANDSPEVRQALRSSDLALRGTAVEVFGASQAADRLKVLREVYDASPGDAWVAVRTAVVEAAGANDGRAIHWHAASDPARAVHARARQLLRGVTRETPAAPPVREQASPFVGRGSADDPQVVLETSRGEMRLRLLPDAAPTHVAAMVRLVRDGFYDGASWHRVVSNFVVQGGDPRGDGWGGADFLLRDEVNRVRFERGTVGMPKGGPDTGGGQIFIMHVPAPHLDGNYTAFGQVISGIEIVDRLEVGDKILRARLE